MDLIIGKNHKRAVLTMVGHKTNMFLQNKIARHIGATIYFADPFCSGQKGAVENANKLLRQYFPKGTDFRKVEQAELDKIQAKINRRPREKLNFPSPLEQFCKHFR